MFLAGLVASRSIFPKSRILAFFGSRLNLAQRIDPNVDKHRA